MRSDTDGQYDSRLRSYQARRAIDNTLALVRQNLTEHFPKPFDNLRMATQMHEWIELAFAGQHQRWQLAFVAKLQISEDALVARVINGESHASHRGALDCRWRER